MRQMSSEARHDKKRGEEEGLLDTRHVRGGTNNYRYYSKEANEVISNGDHGDGEKYGSVAKKAMRWYCSVKQGLQHILLLKRNILLQERDKGA